MTNKAYELIKAVLEYGYVNFRGGIGAMERNEFQARDNYLYEKICELISDLDEGGENNEETR